ncbi:unnamed protein product [Orchesella dallaii]|uniref:F-box domain-containing protein n=1 Tax=Orchesella dallaii TaxID=48710 RepID=A0ABP1QC45_9HEXA
MDMDGTIESLDSASSLTIDILPNELLHKTFLFLDGRSKNTAASVSKRWHTVVDSMIGRKVYLGNQCQSVPQDQERFFHPLSDFSTISKLGVSECVVGEIVAPNRTRTFLTYLFSELKKAFYGDETPEFKYPYLVQSLHFDGPIPCDYFNSMVKSVINLQHIEFHMTAFCCLQTSSLEALGWKRLKSLRMWGHRLTEGIFTTFYPADRILPNVLMFLSNYFPALSEYYMEYPFDIRDEKTFTQQVLSFLKRHQTLLKFRICVNISLADDSSEFETATDREWIKEAKITSKRLKLKTLEILVSSMRKVRLARLWLAFVEQQQTLETAYILSFRIPLAMISAVCENNWQTLKKFFISRIIMNNNSGRAVQLDCNELSRCDKLKYFTCEGMLSNFLEPGLINACSLPKSIVHLEIGGLPLLHADAHDLFFELPELKQICLTDVGNLGRFGITIDTIKQVIVARRIMVVTIYRSVCGEFPTGGIPNGDHSVEPQPCIILKAYEILEFKLNEDGFYENMRRQSLYEDDEFDE